MQVGREAATVEEKNDLIARRQGLAHSGIQRFAPGHSPRLGHPRRLPQIDDGHRWQGPRIDPLRQAKHADRTGVSEVEGLERWGGAAQDEARRFELRPYPRDVAGVVAGRAPLLVATLVLLVHDDGAEPLHRREHRRARTHGHPPLTAAQRAPRIDPLAVGES